MDNGAIVTVIFSFLAAIVGGIIGAISAQAVTQRRIQMKNVTQERAKWRDKIRCLVPKVHEVIMMADNSGRKKQLQRYQNIFRTLLNPTDPEDKKIIEIIDPAYRTEEQAKKFGELISFLLKHDWERAKEEVKHPLFQWRKPQRQEFQWRKPQRQEEPERPQVGWLAILRRRFVKTCAFLFFEKHIFLPIKTYVFLPIKTYVFLPIKTYVFLYFVLILFFAVTFSVIYFIRWIVCTFNIACIFDIGFCCSVTKWCS